MYVITFMKKLLKPLISLSIVIFGGRISLVLAQAISSRNSENNNVPDFYYANYKFADDLEAIKDWFTTAEAKHSLHQEISRSEFAELSQHFDKVFPNLTKDYASVYERCSLLASSLANWDSDSSVDALLWNTCWKPLKQAFHKINSSYTVQTSVISNPNSWPAPLTVTFDARGSRDPSLETLPERNSYRYYRDEKWVDTPIWEWQVVTYTFKEFGKFIVHFVARSSNVDNWILDGEKNITINVTPKAADIVVYANTRRMSTKEALKIWITEGERWVVFDGSLTAPRERREILKHRWTITNNSIWFSYDSKRQEGAPSYINVPLKWNWEFKVKVNNEGNKEEQLAVLVPIIFNNSEDKILKYTFDLLDYIETILLPNSDINLDAVNNIIDGIEHGILTSELSQLTVKEFRDRIYNSNSSIYRYTYE